MYRFDRLGVEINVLDDGQVQMISFLYAERAIWALEDDGRCTAGTKGSEVVIYLPQVEFKKAVSRDYFAEKHTVHKHGRHGVPFYFVLIRGRLSIG
jgi:hypothetical protein